MQANSDSREGRVPCPALYSFFDLCDILFRLHRAYLHPTITLPSPPSHLDLFIPVSLYPAEAFLTPPKYSSSSHPVFFLFLFGLKSRTDTFIRGVYRGQWVR